MTQQASRDRIPQAARPGSTRRAGSEGRPAASTGGTRRRHPAERARVAALALSVGAFGGFAGGLAAKAAAKTSTAGTAVASGQSASTTGLARRGDDGGLVAVSQAVPSSNLSSAQPVTSSHGS